jgi:hypothetical protein
LHRSPEKYKFKHLSFDPQWDSGGEALGKTKGRTEVGGMGKGEPGVVENHGQATLMKSERK